MALIYIDSFDHCNTTLLFMARYDAAQGVTGAGAARTGNGLVIGTGNGDNYIQKTVPTYATYIVGGAFKPTTVAYSGGSRIILEFRDGATSQVYVRVNDTGTLSIVRGDGTVLAGPSSVVLETTAYHYLEFRSTVHNTAGTYDLMFDGASIFSGTAANTRNSAANQVTSVLARWNSASASIAIDDYYIADNQGAHNNTFLGAIHVECKFPSADGTTTGWTRSGTDTGHDWDQVNDSNPDDDTTTIAASALNTKDTFGVQDMTTTAGTVVGVQTAFRARKDDLVSRAVGAVIRSGGTDYDGASHPMAAAYADYTDVWETDPNTTNPWTLAGVNALEAGVKVTA